MSLLACFNSNCNNILSDEHESSKVFVKRDGLFVAYCSMKCYNLSNNQTNQT